MSYTWGASSTDANISNSTITSGGSTAVLSAAISNSGQAVTECGIVVTYHASATKGLKIEILRTYDGGTNYQVDADSPQAFLLPFTAGATIHWVWSVPGTISQFKVNAINLDTGQSATAVTLKTRQATN
jgi:hypothetical protein